MKCVVRCGVVGEEGEERETRLQETETETDDNTSKHELRMGRRKGARVVIGRAAKLESPPATSAQSRAIEVKTCIKVEGNTFIRD
jgi:hypothetical protein